MDTTEALAVIISGGVVPLLVWGLDRSGWTGDQKRLAVVILSLLLGGVTAVIIGTVVVPEPVSNIIASIVINAGAVLVASQGVFKLIEGRIGSGERNTHE